MAQTNINIRMDEDLKREFDNLCNDLDLTMTTVLLFLQKPLTDKGHQYKYVNYRLLTYLSFFLYLHYE